MTPTENTKWEEMPPKYKSTNISKNVKFRENHLLTNVDSVKKGIFENS